MIHSYKITVWATGKIPDAIDHSAYQHTDHIPPPPKWELRFDPNTFSLYLYYCPYATSNLGS